MTGKRRLTRLSLVVSEAGFCSWLGEALPGAVLQYHRGFLALDVDPHSGRLSEGDHEELRRVALRARWASEHGLVHLVQRRHGLDDYTYLAVRRNKPDIGLAARSHREIEEATDVAAAALFGEEALEP